jgi:hypothetical protein
MNVGEVRIPAIPAVKNLSPSRKSIVIPVGKIEPGVSCRVVLDPGDKQYEICETNNTAAVVLR